MSTNAGNADNTSGLDLPTDSEGWCITRKVQEDKYKFVWKIENFSEEISKPADIMESSEFTILSPDNVLTSWKLLLYPNHREDNIGYVGGFLENQEEKEII